MGNKQHVQRDFSAGEISSRMLMRADSEIYRRGAVLMDNFWPTPMGSALRAPGTIFIRDIEADQARIIPYLTFNNEQSLLLFTDSNVRLIRNITDILETGSIAFEDVGGGTFNFRKEIVEDAHFTKQLKGWTLSHQEIDLGDEGSIGVYWRPDKQGEGGRMTMKPRVGASGQNVAVVRGNT